MCAAISMSTVAIMISHQVPPGVDGPLGKGARDTDRGDRQPGMNDDVDYADGRSDQNVAQHACLPAPVDSATAQFDFCFT